VKNVDLLTQVRTLFAGVAPGAVELLANLQDRDPTAEAAPEDAAALNRLAGIIARKGGQQTGSKLNSAFSLSADAFLARDWPPVEYLWKDALGRGLVQRNGVTALVSASGVGKTWLSFFVSARVFVPAGLRTLMVAQEGAPEGLKRRLAAATAGNRLGDRLYLERRPGLDLRKPADVSWLRDLIAEGGFQALVIDTMATVTPGTKEKEVEEWGLAWNVLTGIAQDLRVTVLVLHHTTKAGARAEESDTTQMRGHSVADGAVDGILMLKKRKAPKGELRFDMTVAKQREGEDGTFVVGVTLRLGESMELEFEEKAEGNTDGQADLHARLLAAIPVDGTCHGMSQNELEKALGGNRQVVREALDALVGQHRVGVRAGPRNAKLYSRVPPATSPESGGARWGEVLGQPHASSREMTSPTSPNPGKESIGRGAEDLLPRDATSPLVSEAKSGEAEGLNCGICGLPNNVEVLDGLPQCPTCRGSLFQ
jgi:hypothetical protein